MLTIALFATQQGPRAQGCNNNHPCSNRRTCYCSSPNHCRCVYFPTRPGDVSVMNEKKWDIDIFPNPVSTSTTISFSPEQSGKVSLKIVDVQGRLISVLSDKIVEAGENELVWQTNEVTAGIYFLQIQSAENQQMEKLIVTK